MQTRIVEKPEFILAGVAADTTQACQAEDAGRLAARFFGPGFVASLRGRPTRCGPHRHGVLRGP